MTNLVEIETGSRPPRSHAPTEASTLLANGVALSAAFWILAILSLAFSRADVSIATVLLIATVFCLLSVLVLLRRGGLALLSPFTAVIVAIAMGFGVRALYLVSRQDPLSWAGAVNPRFFTLDPRLFARPLILIALFTIFFGVGYVMRLGRAIAGRLPTPPAIQLRGVRLIAVWIVLLLVAASLYILLLRSVGVTLAEAFGNPVGFRGASSRGGLYYVAGCALWSVWSLFWLPFVAAIERPFSYGRTAVLILLFVVAVVFTLPFGSRGFVLIPVLGVLWALDSAVFRQPLHVLKLAPVLALLVIGLGLFGLVRIVAQSGELTLPAVANSLRTGGVATVVDQALIRFDTFDFLVVVLNKYVSSGQHFLVGRSLIDLLVQPVPRALYPDKPSQTSAFLTNIFYPEAGRTWTPEYGLIAELYINFWAFGVLLGAMVFGILIRALDDYLQRHRHSPAILFWYAPLVTIPMSWTMSGFNSFASVVFILDTFLAVVVVLLLLRRRTPTTLPA